MKRYAAPFPAAEAKKQTAPVETTWKWAPLSGCGVYDKSLTKSAPAPAGARLAEKAEASAAQPVAGDLPEAYTDHLRDAVRSLGGRFTIVRREQSGAVTCRVSIKAQDLGGLRKAMEERGPVAEADLEAEGEGLVTITVTIVPR
jgi:hypothetical protein